MIIDAPPAAVKSVTPSDIFPLALRAELHPIEIDARRMGGSFMDEMFDAMSDAEVEMMAGAAAFAASIDSGLLPW